MSYTPPASVSGGEQQSPPIPNPSLSRRTTAGPPPYSSSNTTTNPPHGSSYDHFQSLRPAPPAHAQAQQIPQGVYAPGPPRDPKGPPRTGMAAFTAALSAPGESIEALLNPPPPSFLREPAQNMSYAPFELIALVGSSELDKGFGVEVPPWAPGKGPHPFATHDVREEDWQRFLGDLKKAAALAGRDKVAAGVVPMAAGIGIAGSFLWRAMEGWMRTRKRGPATSELVDHWNHFFFNPRHINLTLARGTVAFSGQSDGPPPDVLGGQYHPSPDADSEDDAQHGGASSSTPLQNLSRRGRRGMGREEKQQREREERHVRGENWRLVISPA